MVTRNFSSSIQVSVSIVLSSKNYLSTGNANSLLFEYSSIRVLFDYSIYEYFSKNYLHISLKVTWILAHFYTVI